MPAQKFQGEIVKQMSVDIIDDFTLQSLRERHWFPLLLFVKGMSDQIE